jgi:class 3 adenylate cyclase
LALGTVLAAMELGTVLAAMEPPTARLPRRRRFVCLNDRDQGHVDHDSPLKGNFVREKAADSHGRRAQSHVRAGLELVAAVGILKTHAPLQTRVGIATGLVVVGDLIGSGASQEQAIVAVGVIAAACRVPAIHIYRCSPRPAATICS